MALFQRQEIRQTQGQSLVMTPQLQQAIKLLQLSTVELAAFVEQQLEQNPLLQRADGAGEVGTNEPVEAPQPEIVSAPAAEDLAGLTEAIDADFGNVWDAEGPTLPSFSSESGRAGGSFDGDEASLEQVLGEMPTLRDHLVAQLQLDILDPADRIVALYLIDMLDAAGYLSGALDEVVAALGCTVERATSVLERLQRFDPPGIFARNLSECLALQLRDRNRLDPAMQALLDNLDLLARRDFAELRRVCGVDDEDLAEMAREIRRLDPKPALRFESEPVQTLIPDIYMRMHPEGGWIIELNTEALPRVLVDSHYYARIRKSCHSRQDKDYVAEQYNAANWLVKSLHQRATTVLKVATEIVRQQDAFFVHGIEHLRPLTLRDIAEAIDMHESTVSRVTANKHIATPRGLFELKYFFTSAIASATGGEAHSAEAVRHRIKILIDNEPPAEVLSDDRIVEILRRSGIDIARRTVAKYREAMRIPSSVQRRREKVAGLAAN